MVFLRNFFSGIFSQSSSKLEEYEPSNTPFPFIFSGGVPRSHDGVFYAKISELTNHSGRYLIVPHDDTEWLMFMYVTQSSNDVDTLNDDPAGYEGCMLVNTALPASDYVLTTTNKTLSVNKVLGSNLSKIDTKVVMPDSFALKFSIADAQYTEADIKDVIFTKDYIAYRVSDGLSLENKVELHEIRANVPCMDYVRWEDGSLSGEGYQQLLILEVEMMLPEDIKENARNYWRPE